MFACLHCFNYCLDLICTKIIESDKVMLCVCVWEIHGIILSFISLYNSYEYNNSTYVMMTSSSKGDMKLLLSLSHYYHYYYYYFFLGCFLLDTYS